MFINLTVSSLGKLETSEIQTNGFLFPFTGKVQMTRVLKPILLDCDLGGEVMMLDLILSNLLLTFFCSAFFHAFAFMKIAFIYFTILIFFFLKW